MNAEQTKRLTDFSVKVMGIVQGEPNTDGIYGCLVGIGIGGMMGHGATEEEVRVVFERSLQSVVQARAQLAKESS